MCITLSQTPRTGFLVTRLKYDTVDSKSHVITDSQPKGFGNVIGYGPNVFILAVENELSEIIYI